MSPTPMSFLSVVRAQLASVNWPLNWKAVRDSPSEFVFYVIADCPEADTPDVAVAMESDSCAIEVVVPNQNRKPTRTEEFTSSRPCTPEPVPDVPVLHREPSSQRKRLVDLLGDDNVDEKDSVEDGHHHQPSSSDVESASSPSTVRGHDLCRSGQEVPHEKGDVSQALTTPRSALRVTYARQRSFLSNDVDSLEPLTAESINRRLDFAAERPSLVLDTEEDDLNTGTVRSIHELRRAGANARFQGIVDSIFEDIEDSGGTASARRSALIHLCEKLTEDDYARRFLQTNGVDRLANCVTERLDDMAAYLAICAYVLVLGHQPLPTSVYAIFWPRIVKVVSSLVALDADIAKLVPQRRFGLSKANQAAVRDISLRVGESQPLAGQALSKISPQRVVLRAVQLTVQKVTERDIVEAFPDSAVSQLVNLLLKHSAHVTDLEPSSYEMVILDSVFSILEAVTTVSRALGRQHQQALKPLSETSHLLSSLSQANEEPFAHLLVLLLKVILNVTNNNPYLCDNFATPELIQALTDIVLSNFRISSGEFIEETNHTLDIVILCLGGLINLTEESERARQVILHHKDDSRTLLEKLLDLFSTGFDNISEVGCPYS